MKFLMAGSRGQAKDLLSIFQYENHIQKVSLFDDANLDGPKHLWNKIDVLQSEEAARRYFEEISPCFLVAIASPPKRKKVYHKLISYGGIPVSFKSSRSNVSDLAIISNEGSIILVNCDIAPNVKVDKGALINVKNTIETDSKIGAFTSLAPDVHVMKNVEIGENCIISTGVTVLPGVRIGNNVKVWMNKTVDQNLPDNTNFI